MRRDRCVISFKKVSSETPYTQFIQIPAIFCPSPPLTVSVFVVLTQMGVTTVTVVSLSSKAFLVFVLDCTPENCRSGCVTNGERNKQLERH